MKEKKKKKQGFPTGDRKAGNSEKGTEQEFPPHFPLAKFAYASKFPYGGEFQPLLT